jgi:D-alanyl-D-alanine carboxypeptidase
VIGQSWESYGLGMQMLGPLRGSSGAVPGYLSAMYADPASGLTIVVALNNSTPGPGFAQLLAQRLASIVSKTPAKEKGAKVVASLPWSEQQAVDGMTKSAPCPAKKAG